MLSPIATLFPVCANKSLGGRARRSARSAKPMHGREIGVIAWAKPQATCQPVQLVS
jgi:hypothetical protein